jgi:hypothetical protein
MNPPPIPTGPEERSIVARISFGILWFVLIFVVSRMIIGGIVGAAAGANLPPAEAFAAGQAASIAFFQQYGTFVLIAQVLVTLAFSWLGVFPGTSRFKSRR